MAMLLKRFMLILSVLIVFSTVNASLQVLYPVDQKYTSGSIIEAESLSVQPGETFTILVSRNSDTLEWTSIEAVEDLLPVGWMQEFVLQDKTLELRVSVPNSQETGLYNLTILASNEKTSENFTLKLNIKKGLLSAVLRNPEVSGTVGESFDYTVLISNQSIAPHIVNIESDLPSNWYVNQTITLEPKESKEIVFEVFPTLVGEKRFSIEIKSNLNSYKVSSMESNLKVYPTLQGKLLTSMTGLQFYQPGLIAVYALNSLLASISQLLG